MKLFLNSSSIPFGPFDCILRAAPRKYHRDLEIAKKIEYLKTCPEWSPTGTSYKNIRWIKNYFFYGYFLVDPPNRLLLIPGTGNGERGTGNGNGERGTGNGERGTGNGERGTGNGERGTGVWERGTGNGERGTGNGERESGNGSLGTSVQR